MTKKPKTVSQKLMKRAVDTFAKVSKCPGLGTEEWEESVTRILYNALRGAYVRGFRDNEVVAANRIGTRLLFNSLKSERIHARQRKLSRL